MIKQGNVIDVQSQGSFESQYGTLYTFLVRFDNGDQGQYSSKNPNQDKFIVGQSRWYELTQQGQYTKIKPERSPEERQAAQPQQATFKKEDPAQDSIERQTAFKGAIELCVAGKIEENQIHTKTFEFYNLLKAKPQAQPQQQVFQMPQGAPPPPDMTNMIPDNPIF